MENKPIEPGDNVFVHVPDNDDCYGSNGIVDSILDQGVIVDFGPEFGYMFDGKYSRGITKMLFDPSQLERFELIDHPKIRMIRLSTCNVNGF